MDLFHSSPITRREAIVALGAVALAACMSDDSTDPGNGNGDGDVEVDMTNQLAFSPATVNIEVGESVTWRNTSSSGIVHTATCDPDLANDPDNVQLPAGASAWNSGAMAPGDTFTRTFTVAGTYRYFCDPHEAQGMVGTIVVG